jgi:hypothetical protein
VSNKINHNRPNLKLLDNFRRELARAGAHLDSNSGQEFGAFGSRIEREDALKAHELKCETFAPEMRVAMSHLRNCFAELQQAQIPLSTQMRSEVKSRFQKGMVIRFHKKEILARREALIDAGAIVFSGILFGSEHLDGDAWNWLVEFIPLLDKGTASEWSKMLELLTERSLPLAVAQKASDSPEGAERFLGYLTDGNSA